MPTRHRRIAVTEDEELANALERVASLLPPDTPSATAVHDLAIRGVEHLLNEGGRRQAALQRVAEWSTSEDGLDWKALERVRDDGWRDFAEG